MIIFFAGNPGGGKTRHGRFREMGINRLFSYLAIVQRGEVRNDYMEEVNGRSSERPEEAGVEQD